ncbi:Gfo/Idh/MocA family oxidoreductase [candidate division TA06 bacterium]|uniref:Gfo/Idh/MocA family oxidoreductase n=1 Tax=candidate division TA06 bacterium TaxID=2250710 RepID=A0A523XII9_UNCT6|nr:MAG: Gfo/Idh/MocA family oxidoreductase [candidate division TA06 bacterium]
MGTESESRRRLKDDHRLVQRKVFVMIKLAIVGAGYWGPNLIRNFMSIDECEVKLICDSDPEQLTKVGEGKAEVELTTDSSKVVNSDADAVVVATSAETHYALVKEILGAGKDVFVEKPLTLSVSEGEELVELADSRDRILMVGHILLYHPAVKMLKSYITDGTLGKVYYLYSARLNLGRVRRDENALWAFAPHDVSIILHLLESMPDSVQASGECYLRDGIFDVVFMSMHFADKSMAQVHVSWLDPHKTRKITVVGSKKMAVFDDVQSMEKIRIYDKGFDYTPAYASYPESLTLRIGDIHIPKIDGREPLGLECEHFLECIKTRKKPVSDGENGLRVLRVLEAAQKSLDQKGKPFKP